MNKTLALIPLLAAAAAQAHVTLETAKAPAGAPFKAVFRVGHGCGEGRATHTLRVSVPAGFRGAHPMPKAGWAITLQREGQEVREVTWRATTRDAWVEDAHYDEFTLRGVPAEAGALWFKVLQGCEGGDAHWAEVPAAGTSTKGLKAPAALLDVLPPAPAAGHVH